MLNPIMNIGGKVRLSLVAKLFKDLFSQHSCLIWEVNFCLLSEFLSKKKYFFLIIFLFFLSKISGRGTELGFVSQQNTHKTRQEDSLYKTNLNSCKKSFYVEGVSQENKIVRRQESLSLSDVRRVLTHKAKNSLQ